MVILTNILLVKFPYFLVLTPTEPEFESRLIWWKFVVENVTLS